ncbi:MAG: acyltransferase, partial [Oscillospiraceae bacterium]|nr:acyltransferase [Oscillospiraceae bacterium]
MRRPYLDAIRGAAVLLVLVYHVFYMFNAAGVLGGVGPFAAVQPQDALLYFVYPWFMALLFVVSGMCSRYALEKKSEKEFIAARTRRLLVPSTLGLLVFQWIVGYFNVLAGGGLDMIPVPLRYPIFALSGTGPLWFIQVLWLFSLLLCLLRRAKWPEKLWVLGAKCTLPVLLAFAVVIWAAAQVLNLPILTTYRFGIYGAAFFLGYFVLSHEEVENRLEKARLPLLASALALGCIQVAVFWGQNYAGDACLKSPLTNLYAWLMTLAVLACGKAWVRGATRFSSYMAKAGFGIYAVHYLLIIAPCYYLKNFTQLPPALIYLAALVIVLAGSPLLYELLRRIPVVRWAVLGIRGGSPAPKKRQSQVLCKPSMWCRIEAPHRRFLIWPEEIAVPKKTSADQK